MSRQLADLLVRDRVIAPQVVADIQSELGTDPKNHSGYMRRMIEKRIVSESKLLIYLSQKFGLPSINLEKFEVSPDVIKLVPVEIAAKNQVIPIQANQKGTLVVALADPTRIQLLEGLKFVTKMNVEAVLTTFSAFDASFSKYYGKQFNVSDAIDSFRREKKKEDDNKSVEDPGSIGGIELVQVHEIDQAGPTDQDQPVITLVNGLLTEAIKRRASDIHVEPYEKRFRVRFRLDGTMVEAHEIPLDMRRAVVARLKIMSRMDIGETRVPQDGRIKLKVGKNEIDFRVNSLPTIFGEKIVLRLLAKDNVSLSLDKIGMNPDQMKIFKRGIASASGMVLVTGPTGSGKTTTLYSALAELNKVSDNISTAEDPVEYNFDGINQVQVNKDLGMTFANVLRAFLRQDPDIILVGEIRDYETAEVSIQAALTGHLVLSTLHTNDAPATIMRLTNMGVEPFLITAAVNTVVAQRLLRTICSKCKTESPVPAEKLHEMGLPSNTTVYRGQGCSACNRTGYKGRTAIYEVMEFSQTLKEMVLRGETLIQIKQKAVEEGMRTLRQCAMDRVAQGLTSLEEAVSMTMEG